EHRAEARGARGEPRRAARERAFERARLAQFGPSRGPSERRRLARERSLPRGSTTGELLVDERALAVGQACEGLGMHLLDRLGRCRADEVAVTLERPLVVGATRGRRRCDGLCARGGSAEQSIQESHGASVAHGTEPDWGVAGTRLAGG